MLYPSLYYEFLTLDMNLSAASRSAGVSMPIVGEVVIAADILYPAWSHLSCSSDSAFSSGDWGREVSRGSMSLR